MRTIGLLGGMGPAAGVDLAGRVVAAAQRAGAVRDEDHPPMILLSVPSIPSRIRWVSGGPSPAGALAAGVEQLERAGAELFAVACHGAHAWWPELTARTAMVGVSMLREGAAACAALGASSAAVLGSAATRRAGLWHDALERAGISTVDPPDLDELDQIIDAAKAGTLEDGRAAALLENCTAEVAVLACTDLPPTMRGHPRAVDPTDATAIRLVELARG